MRCFLICLAVLVFVAPAFAGEFLGTWSSERGGGGARMTVNKISEECYSTYGDSGRHRWSGFAYLTASGELMEVYKLYTSEYTGYQTWVFVSADVIEYTSFDKTGKNQGSGRYYRVR